jgi:hypothetical protein
MACAEDVRLKAIYDAALSAWLEYRRGKINGVLTPRTTFPLRKQLLQSRLKAANDLYNHSLSCPLCKTSLVKSIDRTELFT